ncbi:hypothetical protein ACGFW5_33000 [Streptomyces sp. NPDC048416]|uniref:hypothetical protein n=1 Tax=Streptomyces sp. NPDC048416 TaxID=3365546 RepID=UPI00371C6488
MANNPRIPDVVPPSPQQPQQTWAPAWHLGGAEAAVIIALVVTAAALVSAGMPMLAVLQLLLGAGLISAVIITALHIRSSQRLRMVIRTVFGAIQ